MPQKEAKARIKINNLLTEAGWRFFDDENGKANILLENNIAITETSLNNLGDNFEKVKKGFIDYLLTDEKGFPFIVVEAKKEDIDPLFAKEQARKYANSQNCRFVILSNGNVHYLWDLKRGNPQLIHKFPTPDSFQNYKSFLPDTKELINEVVESDYVVRTQRNDYDKYPEWIDTSIRKEYIEKNKFRFLRHYQIKAIKEIQKAVKNGKDRFLFEMATGTGKTLTAAAVIKLFLRTKNARRVLFLVDRLELETQADTAFKDYLKIDYNCSIYKDNRDDWRKSEIVVSTVQSFTHNNKFKRIFAPDDFDLVISDEAHRSIAGNGRSVFEYFVGYKLGLTATPKDYLKKIDIKKLGNNDPREIERRYLLDTYNTFGCSSGEPTFRYSLLDGVKDGFLVNPKVVDARTDVTTQLLSDKGFIIQVVNEDGEDVDQAYGIREYEKSFFSDDTNQVFCKTFIENAFRDPITNEIGKTLIFCVSQKHAAKITQILNKMADKVFPNKYNSDFAVQVTSSVTNSKQFTINFSGNKLNGFSNFNELYRTSKSRVCVTVGMMTTGYDCTDILNLCMMRPIFSPSDFIQIKGRGTRKHDFKKEFSDKKIAKDLQNTEKLSFKLFDFFANCEYFEEKFNYDEVLKLPEPKTKRKEPIEPPISIDEYENTNLDYLKAMTVSDIGIEGMKIDRKYFEGFEDKIKNDKTIQELVNKNELDKAEEYVEKNLLNIPKEFYTIDKLQKSLDLDRKLTIKEILEKIFGFIAYFKSKNDLLEEEFDKFDSRYLPNEKYFMYAKNFFKSYISDENIRKIVDSKRFAELNGVPNGEYFKMLSPELRALIPEYIKQNLKINKFTS